jgi:hypothetical protein
MASPDLINAFDDCVERLREGQSVDDCLRTYPHYAPVLRPMLETGLAVQRAAPVIPPAARARVRARVMQAAAQTPRRAPWWSSRLTLIAASLVVLLFVAALIAYLNRNDGDHLRTEPIPASETATSTPAPSLTAVITPTVSATATLRTSPTPPAAIPETAAPSLTLTPTAAPECRFAVTVSSANLREGPGTGYRALGFTYAGNDFSVAGLHTSETWVEVSTPDGERWIATSTGELRGDCSGVPISDTPLVAGNDSETVATPTGGETGGSVPTPAGGDNGSGDDGHVDDHSDDGGDGDGETEEVDE